MRHQNLDHVIDRAFPALGMPGMPHRIVDEAALGIAEVIDMPCHLPDDRLEHGKSIDKVVLIALDERGIDHREGVEAEPVTQAKLDELPAQHLGHVFERTTVVDHDDPCSYPCKGSTELLERNGLTGTRLAEHRHVVVAGAVLEG